MSQVEITLGGVTVPVYAQRHAYLTNRLGPTVQAIVKRGENLTESDVLAFLGEGVYDALVALIPTVGKRIPRWQFRGFASAEAEAADEYDPEADESPTVPEIREAFATAIRVNGLDVLKAAGSVVDPKLLRALISERLAESIASPSSPPPNGGSELTSSTPSSPTSTASEDSPSPASTAS